MIRPDAGKIKPKTPGWKPSYQFPQHGVLKEIVIWFSYDIAFLREIHFSFQNIISYYWISILRKNTICSLVSSLSIESTDQLEIGHMV